ncbi:hypothetical protein QTO34_012165 [Cnephaeus nilssonii]|uniref:RILP-like protein 2 n=1 Tax=Cnephaeus nilssonii TaxID=3371016 RepID=A0AA40LDX5_CNENI|nr:hypothetical protein QTO34_012165 [Eptesicus nilssonii]
MEEPPLREEEEEEEEEDEAGPEGALGKSPFQLTAEDVYDMSYVVGRELMALGSDPRVTQLQFKIVRVLEMLETLVNEGSLAAEELRLERDSLRKEVEGLRREGAAASPEGSLGPDKMVVDLTDPNRPRFTLQELRDVLQERNKLKAQLLLAQEELQCYKRWALRPVRAPSNVPDLFLWPFSRLIQAHDARRGLIPAREGPEGRRGKDAVVARASNASRNKEEKTIIRKLSSKCFILRSSNVSSSAAALSGRVSSEMATRVSADTCIEPTGSQGRAEAGGRQLYTVMETFGCYAWIVGAAGRLLRSGLGVAVGEMNVVGLGTYLGHDD